MQDGIVSKQDLLRKHTYNWGLSTAVQVSGAVRALRSKSSPLVPPACGFSTAIPQPFTSSIKFNGKDVLGFQKPTDITFVNLFTSLALAQIQLTATALPR